MEITLDQQVITQHCPECDVDFTAVRGSVYDGGQAFGLYLIGLPGHSPRGRLAHLAIALLDPSDEKRQPCAVAIEVIGLPEQFGFSAVDWTSSPWRNETYLGEMLDRQRVLSSPHRLTIFHIAEHVVELPAVQAYFC